MGKLGRNILFIAKVIQTIGTLAREGRNMHFAIKDHRYHSQRDAYMDERYGRELPTNARPPRYDQNTRKSKYDYGRRLHADGDGMPPNDYGD